MTSPPPLAPEPDMTIWEISPPGIERLCCTRSKTGSSSMGGKGRDSASFLTGVNAMGSPCLLYLQKRCHGAASEKLRVFVRKTGKFENLHPVAFPRINIRPVAE
jgi:hypothetical protein